MCAFTVAGAGGRAEPGRLVVAAAAQDEAGDKVNVLDVFYLINALFAGAGAPVGSADVNGDGIVDVLDVFYLINYLFAGGAAPV